jgi:hypothetical protein
MAREIDRQRKREDPEYKGAFHERKWFVDSLMIEATNYRIDLPIHRNQELFVVACALHFGL